MGLDDEELLPLRQEQPVDVGSGETAREQLLEGAGDVLCFEGLRLDFIKESMTDGASNTASLRPSRSSFLVERIAGAFSASDSEEGVEGLSPMTTFGMDGLRGGVESPSDRGLVDDGDMLFSHKFSEAYILERPVREHSEVLLRSRCADPQANVSRDESMDKIGERLLLRLELEALVLAAEPHRLGDSGHRFFLLSCAAVRGGRVGKELARER